MSRVRSPSPTPFEYNQCMNLAAASSFGILLFFLGTPGETLEIRVHGEQFKALEHILVEVENRGKTPIAICVELGQTSPSPGENGIQAVPSPFVVQANSAGEWHTLMIGPDVGSSRHPVVLEPDKSMPFPLRLSERGEMRLVLSYWLGALPDLDCGHTPRAEKQLKSKTFSVQ